MSGIDQFFSYARERYRIFLRRLPESDPRYRPHGWPASGPWTEDTVLQQFRFCNIFREDDRVTVWMRDRLTRPIGNDPQRQILAAVVFRWFNKIETGDLLRDLLLGDWDTETARDLLKRRVAEGHPILGPAYMIKSPLRMNKVDGLLQCIDNIHGSVQLLADIAQEGRSLERLHRALCHYPYMGPFMAYEAVTDLRHSPVLSGADDILTWASAGPGAARGIGRVHGLGLDFYSHNSSTDRACMNDRMQELLSCSRQPDLWPTDWPSWEMREVEHTLCEFDKYERARLGEGRPKQRFTPHIAGERECHQSA